MSLLNKELTLKIRPLILKGVQYKEIQKELDIKAGTWDYWYWDNTLIENHHQGFRDFVKSCKYERMMNQVESNLEDVLLMNDENDNGKKDAALARVKLDGTKFTAETLGRIDFHKTIETKNETTLTVDVLPPERIEQIKNALRD